MVLFYALRSIHPITDILDMSMPDSDFFVIKFGLKYELICWVGIDFWANKVC